MEIKWYAVATRPGWEKKVTENLTRNEIENFCPVNRTIKKEKGDLKMVEEPLFSSYVFIRISLRQQHLLRNIDGLVNFVHWLGRPAVIRDEEIDALKNFTKTFHSLKLERAPLSIAGTRMAALNSLATRPAGKDRKAFQVIVPALAYIVKVEAQNISSK